MKEHKTLRQIELESNREIIDSLKELNEMQEEYIKQLKAENEKLKTQNEIYKQTLTEIKDMCSEMKCDSLMQNSWCGDSDFKMNCCEKLFKEQILQEISEVEDIVE